MPTTSTTNLKILAFLIAAKIEVNLYRKPGNAQTVVGEFPDNERTRSLIQSYERRLTVPDVPQKSVMQAYAELGYERKRLIMEAL